jgi:hypothetical protein
VRQQQRQPEEEEEEDPLLPLLFPAPLSGHGFLSTCWFCFRFFLQRKSPRRGSRSGCRRAKKGRAGFKKTAFGQATPFSLFTLQLSVWQKCSRKCKMRV